MIMATPTPGCYEAVEREGAVGRQMTSPAITLRGKRRLSLRGKSEQTVLDLAVQKI